MIMWKKKLLFSMFVMILLVPLVSAIDIAVNQSLYYPIKKGSGQVINDTWDFIRDSDGAMTNGVWSATAANCAVSGEPSSNFVILMDEDDFIDMDATNSVFEQTPTEVAISVRFKTPAAFQEGRTILSLEEDTHITMVMTNPTCPNTLAVAVRTAGASAHICLTHPLETSTDYNIFVSYDGGTDVDIYVNGILNLTETGNSLPMNAISVGECYGGERSCAAAGAKYNGALGALKIWNSSKTAEEVLNEYNFCNISGGPPVGGLKTFTITATDTYDGISLNNFTVLIKNESFAFNTSTGNGTILINNLSISNFDNFYDITFGSNESGGYFNKTFLNVNISDTSSLEGNTFQSVQQIFAIDSLANVLINAFTAKTNLSSDTTTTGEVLILIKEGAWQLNITAAGFDKVVTNFTILALQNNTLNVSMGSVFTFNLIREETNLAFRTNLTNTTELNVFCDNQTINIIFNTTNNENNVTQIINCRFTLMQISVDYGILGSYFRTLIPPFSQKEVTWYLIDLVQGDTAIQRIITLLDLTGEFDNSILTVKRAVGGIVRTIIDQRFDIAREVNLFLVKNGLYIISIATDAQEVILGNLIPTEAGTQTITLPKTEFVPSEVTLNGNITWDYTFNTTLNILRLQYEDNTNLTELVRFTVFNGSNPGQQLFIGETNQNSSVTITFNQVFANQTYLSTLFFEHPGLSNVTEKKSWYETNPGIGGALNLKGWTATEQRDGKKWIAWIFIGIWGMLWSRRHIGIGMSTLVIWLWVFKTWQWIEITNIVFGFVVLMAVIGWLVETLKNN